MSSTAESDWVSRFADEVIAEAERRAPGKPIVCASGLSPSGPIHLGNLREVMTPHLVADEIRRRGRECVHIISWDDFDRFRKVPAGIDESWSEHIGKPLTSVPAPPGSDFPNWAEHFKAAMITALGELGVVFHGISQTEQYTSGVYREQILLAMRERHRIDAILGQYRTKAKPAAVTADSSAEEAAAAEGSGAASEDDGGSGSQYFPYKPYCSGCGRDTTTVTAYDDETTELTYTCAFGHGDTVKLSEFNHGKLVWKVDWPMRWAFEGVVFEPSGVDHTSPGSSYVVGQQIVREIFGAEPPIGPMYAFVGITGMAKMSSSKGGVPTPGDALRIMEAPLLRWLYARRRPNQSFKVAFDQEIQRLYDEWDALGTKVQAGTAPGGDATAYDRARRTAEAELPVTPRPLPYRMLASVADITTGDEAQMLRILHDLDPERPVDDLGEVRPRLDCAMRWVAEQMPADARTRVADEPDAELLAGLADDERLALRHLVEGLDEHWSLAGLTTLVYGVPKMVLGLPMDVAPTAELKAVQRKFFILLYRLLTGRETGPRLPTLLLAIGVDRVRRLVTPAA
ncbi:lysine--tRNA ligase [Paractinoplanes abujensis]|uniref:Lysine--tRNA ligase n=1 Tax=Paractinoplanes abujensis TaxID=882441 RepID=A0A7W7CX22_9ACTN|nr:lysine--tRNA ligase [Actinoplanes abujensis]MBB4696241.1 lysyl-tRNA synthetase class 1 [Actinoplanes abujensis]GID22234.1 lysine--tRNA ligase [Actinoplanes abujensis]